MLLHPSKFDYCIYITPPQTQPSSVTDNSKRTPESVFSGSCRRWRVISVEYLPLSESLSESTIHAPHRRPYICALKIKDEIDTFLTNLPHMVCASNVTWLDLNKLLCPNVGTLHGRPRVLTHGPPCTFLCDVKAAIDCFLTVLLDGAGSELGP